MKMYTKLIFIWHTATKVGQYQNWYINNEREIKLQTIALWFKSLGWVKSFATWGIIRQLQMLSLKSWRWLTTLDKKMPSSPDTPWMCLDRFVSMALSTVSESALIGLYDLHLTVEVLTTRPNFFLTNCLLCFVIELDYAAYLSVRLSNTQIEAMHNVSAGIVNYFCHVIYMKILQNFWLMQVF